MRNLEPEVWLGPSIPLLDYIWWMQYKFVSRNTSRAARWPRRVEKSRSRHPQVLTEAPDVLRAGKHRLEAEGQRLKDEGLGPPRRRGRRLCAHASCRMRTQRLLKLFTRI